MISLADRVVKVAGITTRPDEAWMARNLTDWEGGALQGKQYLITNRDTKLLVRFEFVSGRRESSLNGGLGSILLNNSIFEQRGNAAIVKRKEGR